MADDNKAVGPLAAAKMVSLIKAETAKKYDKTGGTINGSVEIAGGLKVRSGVETDSVIEAGNYIRSDLLLSAPLVTLYDPSKDDASVTIGVSGANVAKITSTAPGGGTQYARFKVGTPTGDSDAATKAYVDGKTHDYYDVTVISAADAAQTIDGGIISVRGSADKTVAEIAAAYAAGAIVRCIYDGNILQLVRATDSSYSFAGVGANYGVARSGNITITIMSTTSSGDATWITSAAGELPIPDSDGSQNGCALVVGNGKWMYSADKLIPATPTSNGLMSAADKVKLDGVETGANKTVVDDAMSAESANPVQNKVVKQYIDDVTSRGGDVTGNLNVSLSVSAGGSVSAGRTDADSGIHLERYATDAGRISHGGADSITGKPPLARLKVAVPTEDDDAATKQYVDGSAVRYDAAQALTDDQKFRARNNIGALCEKGPYIYDGMILLPRNADSADTINITPTAKNNVYAIVLDGGPENVLVLLSGLETPTDAQTDAAATVAYVKAKIAALEASGGIDVDDALSATSTNPVQNKAVTAAINAKAGKSAATQSAAGLMSAADKAKLDGVAAGANKTVVDATLNDTSTNPVQGKVIKKYIDDKVAAAGSNITVDAALDAESTNPVQNKAVKSALDGKLDKSGGTLTGNLTGQYITGTWLQSTAAADLGKAPGKIAVLDGSGWVYYRTPAELLADIGAAAAGHTHDNYATKAMVDEAVATRASTSVYGTTKLSNSVTSSSKTLAATPYAVKTALEQAKAYVDSSIAAAINSAY